MLLCIIGALFPPSFRIKLKTGLYSMSADYENEKVRLEKIFIFKKAGKPLVLGLPWVPSQLGYDSSSDLIFWLQDLYLGTSGLEYPLVASPGLSPSPGPPIIPIH